MGRNGSVKKETALEALFRAKQVLGWKERPRPSQKNFESIVVAVNLWHGKNFWRKNKMSHKAEEYKKKRDSLLHSVSVWMDRRKRRGHPSKFVDSKLLSTWEHQVITAACGKDNTSEETTSAGETKSAEKTVSVKPHSHGIHCGHRPVLHKCPKEGGHIDFLVDGTLECRHRSNSLSCCYDTTEDSFCGSLDFLDLDSDLGKLVGEDEIAEWGSLAGGLTDEKFLPVSSSPRGEGGSSGFNKEQHDHSMHCGHRPVLHKCPKSGSHVDFIVDGKLSCRHSTRDMTCCSGNKEPEILIGENDPMEWDSLAKLFE